MLQIRNLPPDWEVLQREGPVLATAIHAGHRIREDLKPYLQADDGTRRREEDPMTGIWAGVGDHVFRTSTSRFEVDLNRPRDKALSANPEDTWGIRVWKESPPLHVVERSARSHDAFYALMSAWIEGLIAEHGRVLVLDLHSYNHMRDGARPAPQSRNPDIDLGVTTSDLGRFGRVVDSLHEALSSTSSAGRRYDVRRNVRYPDGGNFPEWVFAKYGDHVCTVTLEVKKIYMDEWSGEVDLAVVDDLHGQMKKATDSAKMEISA